VLIRELQALCLDVELLKTRTPPAMLADDTLDIEAEAVGETAGVGTEVGGVAGVATAPDKA